MCEVVPILRKLPDLGEGQALRRRSLDEEQLEVVELAIQTTRHGSIDQVVTAGPG